MTTNKKICTLLFVVLSAFVNFALCDETESSVIVETRNGKIKGSTLYSTHGKLIYSFRGVRYAKPPTGNLRFQPPHPVEPSDEVFDATEDGPVCPQPGNISKSEDCLRLNIYTTNLNNNSHKKYPVIFYMHPGGFYVFSGRSDLSGPKYMLDHDVVLVTINYRLGSLGFISTGDSNAPGNNGFKDQILALKWVRDNIATFGGDPHSVTLVGYSAGSLSITLHMVSPMSDGLFHRAIAMSASTTADWDVPYHQMNLAVRQAELLDCPTDNSTIIIECLKTKDAIDIGNSLEGFFESGGDPILVWKPVIEPDCGQEIFLPDDPVKLIQQGHLKQLPFMSGITKYEFAGPAYFILANDTIIETLNNEWERIAPIAFLYERNTSRSKEISKALKDFYLDSQDIAKDERSLIGLRELYADSVIGFPVHRFVDLMANYSAAPLYNYKFSYRGRFSYFYLPSNTSERIPLGPVHHDDLMYLFTVETLFPIFNVTDDEYQIVNVMTDMWTNFAKTGCPTTQSSDFEWPMYDRFSKKYLNIDKELSIDSCVYCDRYFLWDDLFPVKNYYLLEFHH